MKLNLNSILKSTDLKKLRDKTEKTNAGFVRTEQLKNEKKQALDKISTDIDLVKKQITEAIQNADENIDDLFQLETTLTIQAEQHKRIIAGLDETVLKLQSEINQSSVDFQKLIGAEMHKIRYEYSRTLSLQIGQALRSGLREWRETFEDFKNTNQDIWTPELKRFMFMNLQLPIEANYSKSLGISDSDFGPPEKVLA